MPTADGEQHLQQTGQQAVAESWNQPIFPSQDNQGGQKKSYKNKRQGTIR